MATTHGKPWSGEGISILFVRSSGDASQDLSQVLLKMASGLLIAETGSEALELVRERSPDVVLTALRLEDMPGFELCRRIRRSDRYLPVLVIGGEDSAAQYRMVMEAGGRYLPGAEAGLLEQTVGELLDYAAGRRADKRQLDILLPQAETLSSLPVPVALVRRDGIIEFCNRAFTALLCSDRDGSGLPLSAVAETQQGESGRSGWISLLNAVRAGSDWSGTVSCSAGRAGRRFLLASLAAQQQPHEQRGSSVLTLADITPAQESYYRLAIQRNSAYDVIRRGSLGERLVRSLADTVAALERTASGDQAERLGTLAGQSRACLEFFQQSGKLSAVLETGLPGPATEFSLREVTASAQAFMEENCQGRLARINAGFPAHLPDRYLGDPQCLNLIMQCLLEDALTVSEEGAVHLTADVKEKDADGVVLQFSVRCTAASVGENRYRPLGEYIADSMEGAGTGGGADRHGLNLALLLTEVLGGKAWVKSVARQGLIFCFTVSLKAAAGLDRQIPGGTATAPVPAADVPRTVLLAEDNEIDQLTIRSLLERSGYQVISAYNGRQAVDEYEAGSFDVILMDILMPEMDGFQAARMIREKEHLLGCHTPIIALTAYSLKAIHDKCLSVGMDGYLSKPVSFQDLKELFGRVLNICEYPVNSHLVTASDDVLPVLDFHEALSNLDNVDLIREITTLFVAKAPATCQDLIDAILAADAEQVKQHSHKLKGMASNIGAKRFAELARSIQDEAGAGRLCDSDKWLERLNVDLRELLKEIAEFDWRSIGG